ncbi:MAG TPA: 2-C-methyl-D-erythritol 4-phosphate cytidylyltransferase [Draconibacterium sp.]|nr:2-C-methyl-D-erythritol 4-phosphate cytidylyltransferase [Draconibacterium sp.]
MTKKFALIVAGGSGSRMNSSIPKQFMELAGKPVLIHTFEAFRRFDPAIEFVLVLPENEMESWNELCEKHTFHIEYKVAKGGKTRFESVKNGLELLPDSGIVFIHDGVRPLVSEQTLQNCLHTAITKGNALPVVPVSESVRYIDKDKNQSLDRSKYFLVQTPQTFQLREIKMAYQQPFSTLFTDDASVLENTGRKISTVEGNRENIKITFQEDLQFAEALIDNKM